MSFVLPLQLTTDPKLGGGPSSPPAPYPKNLNLTLYHFILSFWGLSLGMPTWRIIPFSKWLGSPLFISHKVRPFGRGIYNPIIGDLNDHHGYEPLTSVLGWSSKAGVCWGSPNLIHSEPPEKPSGKRPPLVEDFLHRRSKGLVQLGGFFRDQVGGGSVKGVASIRHSGWQVDPHNWKGVNGMFLYMIHGCFLKWWVSPTNPWVEPY